MKLFNTIHVEDKIGIEVYYAAAAFRGGDTESGNQHLQTWVKK